jgi:hypothetical protein
MVPRTHGSETLLTGSGAMQAANGIISNGNNLARNTESTLFLKASINGHLGTLADYFTKITSTTAIGV